MCLCYIECMVFWCVRVREQRYGATTTHFHLHWMIWFFREELVCCSLNTSDEKDKAPFGVLIHIGTTSIEKLLPKPIQLVDFDDPNFLQKHENTHFENTKKKLIRKNIEKPHYKNKKIVSLRLIRKKKLIASGSVSHLKFRIYCSKKPLKKQTLEKF